MSAPTPAGRALAELAAALALPPVDLSAARARGSRLYAARRALALVLAVALVVTAAGVRQRVARPSLAASPRAQAALASLVQRALSEAAPGAEALRWDRARVGPAARVRGVPAVTGASSVRTDTAGVVPFGGRGTQRAVLAFRVTERRSGHAPADPCSVPGPLPVRGNSTAQSGCDIRRVLNTPDGVVVRAVSRVLGAHGSTGGSARLEQVREVVLVVGATTYALAERWRVADPTAADDLVPPLTDAQLSLAVRYVATATRAGGPGVATTRLVARQVVTSALASADPGLYPPVWTAPGAASAAAAAPGPPGRPLVDVRETTALQGAGVPAGTQIGYRVVHSADDAGPACALAAVVPIGPGCRQLVDHAETDRTGPAFAARQVVLVQATAAPASWIAVAEAGPSPASGGGPLPLSTDQLLEVAQALAASGPP